jgi:hypothetical protein
VLECTVTHTHTHIYIYIYIYILLNIDYTTEMPHLKIIKKCTNPSYIQLGTVVGWGHAVAQLVEALRYKPDGRVFDSRWRHWNFSLT